jgi:hypothetical protein
VIAPVVFDADARWYHSIAIDTVSASVHLTVMLPLACTIIAICRRRRHSTGVGRPRVH